MTGMVGRFGRIFLRYGCKTLLLLLAVSVIAFALVQEFAMTPFSITIRGVTVATISEVEETKLGAVQEMALLLQDGTEVPLIQGGVVQTCDQVNSWFHFAGPVGSNFQLTWRWSEVMDLSRVSGLQLDGQWYSFD